jgi:NADPH2:quinone reductase
MRVVVQRHGGPEVLRVIDEPPTEPRAGEIRVRVHAAGVGFPDLLMREGTYPGGPKPPFTPGYDLVGEVDAVGDGVLTVHKGERVAALTVYGAYADWVCLPADEVVRVPEGLDAVEAVSLVLNYVTAYQLMHRAAEVRSGERMLVQGAAGGVGSAVLELARIARVKTFRTASTKDLDVVARLGAVAIDRHREDFVAVMRGHGGADVVLDGIGGRTAIRSLRSLRRGGRLVLFGHHATLRNGHRTRAAVASFYAAGAATFALGALWPGRRVTTYQVAKEMRRHFERFSADLEELFGYLAKGEIHPLIAARLPLSEAARAHEMLGAGEVVGKLVLITGAADPA